MTLVGARFKEKLIIFIEIVAAASFTEVEAVRTVCYGQQRKYYAKISQIGPAKNSGALKCGYRYGDRCKPPNSSLEPEPPSQTMSQTSKSRA